MGFGLGRKQWCLGMEEGLIKPVNTPRHLYRRRFMEHRLQGRIQEVGKTVKFTVLEGGSLLYWMRWQDMPELGKR